MTFKRHSPQTILNLIFFSDNIRPTLPLLPFIFWPNNMIVEIRQANREKFKYGLVDFFPLYDIWEGL